MTFSLPAQALRTAHHSAYPAALVVFNLVQGLGIFFVFVYNANTPDMYEGSKYGILTSIIVIISWSLTFIDFVMFLGGWSTFRNANSKNSVPLAKRIWKLISTGRNSATSTNNADDTNGYVIADADGMGEDEVDGLMRESAESGRAGAEEDHILNSASQHHGWGQVNNHLSSTQTSTPARSSSMSSSSTHVGEHITTTATPKFALDTTPKWVRRRNGLFKFGMVFMWRTLIVMAFADFVTGIAVYSGTCRGNYLNGCLAHLIKGGIFCEWSLTLARLRSYADCLISFTVGYGVLTFGRFLGAWSELGWSWNAKPNYKTSNWRRNAPTAESVECFVIFLCEYHLSLNLNKNRC